MAVRPRRKSADKIRLDCEICPKCGERCAQADADPGVQPGEYWQWACSKHGVFKRVFSPAYV